MFVCDLVPYCRLCCENGDTRRFASQWQRSIPRNASLQMSDKRHQVAFCFRCSVLLTCQERKCTHKRSFLESRFCRIVSCQGNVELHGDSVLPWTLNFTPTILHFTMQKVALFSFCSLLHSSIHFWKRIIRLWQCDCAVPFVFPCPPFRHTMGRQPMGMLRFVSARSPTSSSPLPWQWHIIQNKPICDFFRKQCWSGPISNYSTMPYMSVLLFRRPFGWVDT